MARLEQSAVTSPMEQFKELYWDRFLDPVHRCESRLKQIAGRPAAPLGEPCTLTLAAGGKRLRPLLVFMSSRTGSKAGERQVLAAAAVELVHMATLVHDDVLDGASLRRGQPTLLARYGKHVSGAAGDYLFSAAFKLLAQTGFAGAVSVLSQASLDLSRGELAQMCEEFDYELAAASYFERCRLKTSGLFVAACRLGGMLSGCSPEVIEAVGQFGEYLGLSFQLADDILDFEGSPEETGKEKGTDLRDGTVTLPLILALQLDPGIRAMLKRDPSPAELDKIRRRVQASGGIEETRRQALVFARQAVASLDPAAAELDTEPLALMAEASVYRRS